MPAYGKRRSPSQKIGSKGEHYFAFWCEDRGLIPNKAAEDYGIDYFCQIVKPIKGSLSETPSGSMLAVQVRATTSGSTPKIRIDKDDAHSLFIQKHLACLVGINLNENKVHYRFVDSSFSEELHVFLHAEFDTMTIRFDSMADDVNEFDRQLSLYSRPSFLQRLMIQKLQLSIRQEVPGVTLNVSTDQEQTVAIVDTPMVGAAFVVHPDSHEQARKIFFDGQGSPHNAAAELKLNTALESLFDVADQHIIIRGGLGRPSPLTVKHNKVSLTAGFELRCFADEWAYVHPIGIGLVISNRRKQDDVYVYVLHFRVFQGSHPLKVGSNIFNFLKLFKKDALLFYSSKSNDNNERQQLSNFGESVCHLGYLLEAFEKIHEKLEHFHKKIYLSDILLTREYGLTLAFLDTMLNSQVPIERIFSGFTLGEYAEKPIEEISYTKRHIIVPIVANLTNCTVVIRVKSLARLYLTDDGRYCGMLFLKQVELTWDIMKKVAKKSEYPEIWFNRYWPAIRLDESMNTVIREYSSEEIISHPDLEWQILPEQDME